MYTSNLRNRFVSVALCLVAWMLAACGPDTRDPSEEEMTTSPQDAGGLQDAGETADTDSAPTLCAEDERVSSGECVGCPAGTINMAGDDPSQSDTTCDSILCASDQRVESNECVTCPAGTTNLAGDDASGPDTMCDGVMCPSNQQVQGNACVACPPGTTNMAGDDASGTDTACDATVCEMDERVEANQCVSCPPGSTNLPGDDASDADTTCDPTLCAVGERVQANACVACAPGTTNMAGDDASGADTSCVPILCAVDERVEANACVACPIGFTNSAGDDATGPDTSCEDACQPIFGIDCDQLADGYLKASTPDSVDNFGQTVSLSCDRLAVGAAGEDSCADGVNPVNGQADDSCFNAGAVYVFERDSMNNTWVQTAFIKASNSGQFDQFGGALSLSGDRLAVGAHWEDSCADGVDPDEGEIDDSCASAGAVYLFERDPSTNTWAQTAYVKASNSDDADRFGESVSLNNDRLAVGAGGEGSCADGVDPVRGEEDNSCATAGAVYLFEQSPISGVWAQTDYLKSSNSGAGDSFGYAVALDNDQLAVSALGEDSCADGPNPTGGQSDDSCAGAGAVYLFDFDPTTGIWSQNTYLKASNSQAFDRFGRSVSLQTMRLAVGAESEDSCADGINPAIGQADDNCGDAGAVYVFDRNAVSGSWTQMAYLKASNSDPDDNFGLSVSLDGDRLAVGTDEEASCAEGANPPTGQADNSCGGAGAAYLFQRDPATGTWRQVLYLKASGFNPITSVLGGDRFGVSISLAGDRLAVGAESEGSCAAGVDPVNGQSNNSCSSAGAVYSYLLAP